MDVKTFLIPLFNRRGKDQSGWSQVQRCISMTSPLWGFAPKLASGSMNYRRRKWVNVYNKDSANREKISELFSMRLNFFYFGIEAISISTDFRERLITPVCLTMFYVGFNLSYFWWIISTCYIITPHSIYTSFKTYGSFTLHGTGTGTGKGNGISTIEDNGSRPIPGPGAMWTVLCNILEPINLLSLSLSRSRAMWTCH